LSPLQTFRCAAGRRSSGNRSSSFLIGFSYFLSDQQLSYQIGRQRYAGPKDDLIDLQGTSADWMLSIILVFDLPHVLKQALPELHHIDVRQPILASKKFDRIANMITVPGMCCM